VLQALLFFELFQARHTMQTVLPDRVTLEKARQSKMKKDFGHALRRVNAIPIDAPSLPEALHLKAQILWEGFGNREAAECVLARLMKSIPGSETLYQ
jgi:hypothetical protein